MQLSDAILMDACYLYTSDTNLAVSKKIVLKIVLKTSKSLIYEAIKLFETVSEFRSAHAPGAVLAFTGRRIHRVQVLNLSMQAF